MPKYDEAKRDGIKATPQNYNLYQFKVDCISGPNFE